MWHTKSHLHPLGKYLSKDNNDERPGSKIACICEVTSKPRKKRSKKCSCPKLEVRSESPNHGIHEDKVIFIMFPKFFC